MNLTVSEKRAKGLLSPGRGRYRDKKRPANLPSHGTVKAPAEVDIEKLLERYQILVDELVMELITLRVERDLVKKECFK